MEKRQRKEITKGQGSAMKNTIEQRLAAIKKTIGPSVRLKSVGLMSRPAPFELLFAEASAALVGDRDIEPRSRSSNPNSFTVWWGAARKS